MKGCIFCKIAKRELPSHKVYEDKHVLAFAPTKETIIARGHMLVIPKKHYASIYNIPNDELCGIIKAVKLIAMKLRKKLKAEGINILHASGKAAQQSVMHFHLHLAPRYKNDRLDTWPETGYKEKDFPEIYKKMMRLLS